jgi:hypothetical protein
MVSLSKYAALATFCVAAAAMHANASPISVYSTGVSGSVGSADVHYSLVASPYGAAPAVLTAPNSAWVAPPAGTSWISYGTQNGPNQGYNYGLYDYQTTFSLGGGNPATAVISGEWAADDTGQIFLNGVLLPTTAPGYTGLTAFSINAGYINGTNTLDFVVNNSGGGPTGLLVDITSATAAATPEPSSLLLLATGGIGVFGTLRRKLRA